jgi:ubiquinone/menaquinone biosynthesis C-methylase UbiE
MSSAPPSRATSSAQDASVIAQYEGWARVYDLVWHRYMQKTLPVLQRAAGIAPGERVLDLACGTGELERRVADATPGAEVVGVDLADGMVGRARQKLRGAPNVRFATADVHHLPFDNRTFDAVVCANTFHYFTRPHVVLQEAGRVLRPGGRLVILDWCRDLWTCRIMDAVLHRVDPAYAGCYTVGEMAAMLQAASFTVHRRFRYRFDLIWGMMVFDARPSPTETSPLS